MFDHIPLMLAQEGAPPVGVTGSTNEGTGESQSANGDGVTGSGASDQQQAPGSPIPMFWMFLLIIGVFWFFLMGGQRREKKKRAALIAAIKKGDKVQTVGGVLGTVVEVRPSDVLVKVDENANTRIKFARSAIQNILQDKDEE